MNTILSFTNIRNFFISLVVFLIIDMVWLTLIAKSIYSKYLGYLMAPKVNFLAAFIFYIIFIIGLSVFVIHPAFVNDSWRSALFMGMFFGLITYATYDLTNLATVKDWPVFITVIDLIWGSMVSGATAFISFLLIRLFRS
ncbi:MAG: hypothetical protein H6Q59_732 [Firmicutes bacterium]|nr:hypothetical protein [Bacillota bacterium]